MALAILFGVIGLVMALLGFRAFGQANHQPREDRRCVSTSKQRRASA
jgi:hypothetical protein